MWYKAAQRKDPFAPVGKNIDNSPFTAQETKEFYDWAQGGGASDFLKQREDHLNKMQAETIADDSRDDTDVAKQATQMQSNPNIPQSIQDDAKTQPNQKQIDPVYYKKDFTIQDGYINYNPPGQWNNSDIKDSNGRSYRLLVRPDIAPKSFAPYSFVNPNGTYGKVIAPPTPVELVEMNPTNIKNLGIGLKMGTYGTGNNGIYLNPEEIVQLAKENARTRGEF